jgi:hypothetical protein
MPNLGSQNVGQLAASNASANAIEETGAIAAGATYITRHLEVPALNHLAWLVEQTSGVDAVQVQPQLAFRRGALGVLEWVNIVPPFLVAPGTAFTFPLNTVAAQGMRALLTHTGRGGQPSISVTIILSGSG